MKLDIDVLAIVLSIISMIVSYVTMKVTVKFLEKSVDQIQKDFKGMGAKLGRQNDEIQYLKGKFDGRES